MKRITQSDDFLDVAHDARLKIKSKNSIINMCEYSKGAKMESFNFDNAVYITNNKSGVHRIFTLTNVYFRRFDISSRRVVVGVRNVVEGGVRNYEIPWWFVYGIKETGDR